MYICIVRTSSSYSLVYTHGPLIKLKQCVILWIVSELVSNPDVTPDVHCINVTLNVQSRRTFRWKLNVINGEQCVIKRAINRWWSIVYWRELESLGDKTRPNEPVWTLDKQVITENRLINCFLFQVNLHFYIFGASRPKVVFPRWLKARSHQTTDSDAISDVIGKGRMVKLPS